MLPGCYVNILLWTRLNIRKKKHVRSGIAKRKDNENI